MEDAIVTFGNGGVKHVQDFVTAGEFTPPVLEAGGQTPMGEAITLGLNLLRARKEVYKKNGVPYYRPWVFLITDGAPTDDWASAARLVHAEEAANALAFFAVGVQGAEMEKLRQIAPPTRVPIQLQGLQFVEMFLWLSRSQQRVSGGKVGEQTALEPAGWGKV